MTYPGQCPQCPSLSPYVLLTMSISREVNNLRSETMAGVKSRFAVVRKDDILQMLTFS